MGINQSRQVAYMMYTHIPMHLHDNQVSHNRQAVYANQAANAYKAQPQGHHTTMLGAVDFSGNPGGSVQDPEGLFSRAFDVGAFDVG